MLIFFNILAPQAKFYDSALAVKWNYRGEIREFSNDNATPYKNLDREIDFRGLKVDIGGVFKALHMEL